MGRNVDKLNFTRHLGLYSRYFNKEQINTESYTSADPAYFAVNNWGNPNNQSIDQKDRDLQSPE